MLEQASRLLCTSRTALEVVEVIRGLGHICIIEKYSNPKKVVLLSVST